MRIALCDDDRRERELFLHALHGWDSTQQPECFSDGASFLEAARMEPPFDIAFLDIYMPGEDGMDVAGALREISPETGVVFVTISEAHAVDAFSLHALHYLVKPVTTEGVAECFRRLTQIQTKKRRELTLSSGRESRTVYQDEILYIQSDRHAKEIYLTGGRRIRVWISMEELEEKLDGTFLRLGRSAIVNMEQIEQMGTESCLLRNGVRLEFSRRERAAVRAAYDNYLFARLSRQGGFGGGGETMSFYFRHAAGFFLQLAPCGVLCFLPFSEGVFRWPKRRTMGAVTLCELLLALLFPLVLRATRFQQLTGNLYMLGAVLLLAAAYFRLLRDAPAKKLLVLFLVMFYALTQYCAVILALPLVNGGVFSSEMYTLRCLLLWAVTTAVMFPVGVLVSLKIVRDYLAEIAPEHMGRDFVWVMFFTVAYFALIIRYNTLIDYSRPDQIILFAPLLLLLFLQQGLAWWLLLRESVRRRRDAEQQKALEIQQLQYDNLTREMENARRMRHDMRHYLNGLADLMEQGKTAEMKKYLSEVIGQTASRENTVYCKNPTVNGLLQYYAGLAAEAGIRCEIQANCGELSISPADLTVLFGNAMENAIRACKAFSEGRWLRVQAGVIGGSLAIQIENPCAGAPPSGLYRLEDGFLPAAAFLSARSGGGYGLRSIEHTAGKYGGDARFRYDETTHIFTTRIRLNLYPDALK